MLWRAGDWAQAAQLRGHKREVTQLAFSSCAGDAETETGDTEPEAITCSYDRVILWSVAQLVARKVSRCQCGARVMFTPSVPQGGKAGAEAGTTVAREMGDITACSLARPQVPSLDTPCCTDM